MNYAFWLEWIIVPAFTFVLFSIVYLISRIIVRTHFLLDRTNLESKRSWPSQKFPQSLPMIDLVGGG